MIVVPAATVILYGVVLTAAVSFLPWLQTLLAGLLLKVVILLNACDPLWRLCLGQVLTALG